MSNITFEQYQEAREIAAAYERAQAEAAAAARAAYAVPVTALVNSDHFRAVYADLGYMIANFSDDSFFGMPVGSLHTIARNLARQVQVDLDAPVIPAAPEGNGDDE